MLIGTFPRDTVPQDHQLDPYDPASWRQALEGRRAARCSLAPVWPGERLLQGEPEDLLLLRADSLARAAREVGAKLWIEVGANPSALSLLRGYGLQLELVPDAPLLGPWSGGNVTGVRSVQRLSVPEGRDAAWLLEAYLGWVDGLTGVRVRRGEAGTSFDLLGLEVLRFGAHQHSEGRAWLELHGGRLAANHPGAPGSLELRLLPGGREALIGIHHFRPSLPWALYRLTQARAHLLVVDGFARSLARR